MFMQRIYCKQVIQINVEYVVCLIVYLVFFVLIVCVHNSIEKKPVGPSLGASLEPLVQCQNVASLSLFYRYYFGRYSSSELAQLVPLPYSRGRYTHYSDRLHDFSVTIPRCYKDVYVNSFFPRRAKLWNSLPIECFPLTYDLNGLKSRINNYLLQLQVLSKQIFCIVQSFTCFFTCNSMPHSGCSALHRVNPN